MTSVAIQTDRTLMRPFQECDAAALGTALRDANVTETMQFDAPARTGEEATERAHGRIVEFNGHWDRFGFGIFGVFDRQTEALIGYCGLRYNDEFDGDLHISTLIDRPYWSLGFGSEVVRRNLEFAFLEQELDLVYAATRPIQLASIRLMEIFGFVRLPDRMLRHYPMAYASCTKEEFLLRHVAYLKQRLEKLRAEPPPPAQLDVMQNSVSKRTNAATILPY